MSDSSLKIQKNNILATPPLLSFWSNWSFLLVEHSVRVNQGAMRGRA